MADGKSAYRMIILYPIIDGEHLVRDATVVGHDNSSLLSTTTGANIHCEEASGYQRGWAF